MTEQNVTANQSTGDTVYANPALYGKLLGLTRTSPHAAQVMLILMAVMDKEGAVNTTQAVLAHRCDITLQNVEQSIGDLASAELIISVDVSSEPGGPFACLVNPDFVRGEMPDEDLQASPKLQGRELADG